MSLEELEQKIEEYKTFTFLNGVPAADVQIRGLWSFQLFKKKDGDFIIGVNEEDAF